jgi:biopolymer transport protein ExbB
MEKLMTMWDLFKLGGPVMWLLLATSIIALAVILDRSFVFFRWRQQSSAVLNALEPLFRSESWDAATDWCRLHQGPFSSLAGVYLHNIHQSREIREDLLRREGLIIVGHLDRGLRRLAMLSQASTLLGLLGTFHVMIMRVASGEMGGSSGLPTSSVWECFLTTMYGLMIAIPCSVIYQLFEERLDRVTRELEILVSQLDEWRRHANVDPVPHRKGLASVSTGGERTWNSSNDAA